MLDLIKQKCEKANVSCKIVKIQREGSQVVRERLQVEINCARDKKTLIIRDSFAFLQTVLESEFEKYSFIKGYEAVFSAELGVIECTLVTEGMRPASMVIDRLPKYIEKKDELISSEAEELVFRHAYERPALGESVLEFPSPGKGIKVLLGYSSKEHSILTGLKRTILLRDELRPYVTIRIEGLKFDTHDQAKDVLLTLGNSIFFQIDLITDSGLYLAVDRDIDREIRGRRRYSEVNAKFSAPKFQYDHEAISLYWYARTATGMPLLQYLAYYQILEYYFPKYSAKDAHLRIKNLLKDPTFDRDIDRNINRILDAIKVSAKGKALGDERSQIKATINECVDIGDLVDFFEELPERKDFFDVQKKSKTLVSQKILFNKDDHDIRDEVSMRIYALRCRIVHTKEEGGAELLIPFSTELTNLRYDLDLIEFIAKKVLIASCKSLKLP